jgi:hypothetical protein
MVPFLPYRKGIVAIFTFMLLFFCFAREIYGYCLKIVKNILRYKENFVSLR